MNRINKPKSYTSHYILDTAVAGLEHVWITLRAEFKSKKIKKSLILERLIDLAVKDLESNGINSKIYKDLEGNYDH